MPVQGPQQPGFWLPGTEYFALAPNTNIALQGRRRVSFSSPNTTAPASTDNVTNSETGVLLESPFTLTSGIYLHYFYLNIAISGAGLVLNNVAAGLTTSGTAGPTYFLGNPALTTPSINIGTVVLSDRDRLISAQDVLAADRGFGIGFGGGLFMTTQINVNNPEVTPITFHTNGLIIYTRLDGILE